MKPRFVCCLMLLFLGFLSHSNCLAQSDMLDVVYLKDGSIIRGVIIEQVPGVSIKIQTSDKSVFVYQMDQVEKLTRIPSTLPKSRKSPTTALIASLILPGAGQYYNGQALKGVILDVLFVGGAAMVIASSDSYDRFGHYDDSHRDVVIAGAGLMAGSYLWSLIDAPLSASAINGRREPTQITHLLQWGSDSAIIGLDIWGAQSRMGILFTTHF